MITVVIVADRDRLSAMKHLRANDEISILCATDNMQEADAYIRKAQVVVLDLDPVKARLILADLKSRKVSTLAVTDAATMGFTMMEWGATEMQLRNATQSPQYFCKLLAGKIRSVAQKEGGQAVRTLKRPASTGERFDKIIAIGSSTGGTDTVEYILRQLPENIPPILIVQHMPPIFTRMFAERLHNSCRISVWEARSGDPLIRGLALIAPGDYHMVLAKNNNEYFVNCISGERVCNQRPAVDVLFESVAKVMGSDSSKSLGVILTGMGSDGAKGMLTMRQMGAHTIGQDEHSSVVYGMPRAAYECGAVVRQMHLHDIAPAILNFVKS